MKPRRQSNWIDVWNGVDLFAKGLSSQRSHNPGLTLAASRSTSGIRTSHLWYAVVFPGLLKSSASGMLERLGASALQFTSWVSIEIPNALLLEVKGSVKLFGSLSALHARLDDTWETLEQPAQGSIAPTALAALWCARSGKRVCIEEVGSLTGELAALPLACTGWGADWLATLRAMGIEKVGEILRLPRSGVARRLSPSVIRELDVALARESAPRRVFIPRERFRERCDFEAEVETVEYLQKSLEPLVERCATFLRDRQSGVQGLELRLRHRHESTTRVRCGLASITGTASRLLAVMEEKLHRLALRAPVRSMELLSGSLRPLSAASADAFAGGVSGGEAVPHLVERLRARLGDNAVYSVVTLPEHRPEAAWQRVRELSLSSLRNGGESSTAVPLENVTRPVWLLEAPLPLRNDLLSSPNGDMILEQGPERIESGWWDGKDVTRDYYIARQVHGERRSLGARCWVFQERRTKSWYLHGVFA